MKLSNTIQRAACLLAWVHAVQANDSFLRSRSLLPATSCAESIPIQLGVASMKGCITGSGRYSTCWEALLDAVDYGAGNIFYILPESHGTAMAPTYPGLRLTGGSCLLGGRTGVHVFTPAQFTSGAVICTWKGTSSNSLAGSIGQLQEYALI
jgi:hypothetical protein